MLSFIGTPRTISWVGRRPSSGATRRTRTLGHGGSAFKRLLVAAALILTAANASGQREEWLWAIRTEERFDHVARIDEMPASFRITLPKGIGDPEFPVEPRLYASFLEARRNEGPLWVSASLIQARTRRMLEQILMAVERFRQFGGGAAMGRRALLRDLIAQLVHGPGSREAAHRLGAALELAEHPPLPLWNAADRTAIGTLVQSFLADVDRSSPLGFHTRASWLAGAFRQDRLLQELVAMGPGTWPMAVLDAFESVPALRTEYERELDLQALVTNPAAQPSFLPWLQAGGEKPPRAALFPPATSVEGRFARTLGGGDTGFLDAFVAAIRAGQVNLRPRPDGGFLDQSLWALEPLLLKDVRATRAKVETDAAYEAVCEQVFRSALIGARELHVKELEIPTEGEEPPGPDLIEVRVRPELMVEPQLTYYLRAAKAHEFLRDGLVNLLGDETARTIGSWTPVGEPGFRLLDELDATSNYYRGMAAGVAYGAGLDIDALEIDRYGRALGWRDYAFRSLPYLERDPFLDDDVRRVSPVSFVPERGTFRVLGIVGVAVREAQITYRDKPRVTVLTRDEQNELAPDTYVLHFDPQRVLLPYEVSIEFETPHVPTREAWRAMVDAAPSLATLRERVRARG
ncbi:MAG: hypothetical protein H6834_15870 [Planctomycetes bacterium]|nr:hypothetical protein [Planctomycetota bacterium]